MSPGCLHIGTDVVVERTCNTGCWCYLPTRAGDISLCDLTLTSDIDYVKFLCSVCMTVTEMSTFVI